MALPAPAITSVLQVRIGDVSISIEGDVLNEGCESAFAYEPFVGTGKPDIRLSLHRGSFDKRDGKKVFECPPIWSLYRQNGGAFIEIFPDMPGLERTLALQSSPESADLYFSNTSDRFIDPFFGPVMELLMVHTLARGRGIILHGCGIRKGESGILFVGKSGAGKSTLANLWCQEQGIQVLSDDRIIIRKEGEAFRMYGTPWHGEGRFASPLSAKLEGLFFLRHGRSSEVRQIKEIEAVSRLLSCSFPPHWDAGGMGFTLDFFSDLTSRVACEELAFRPDRSAIALLIGRLENYEI